MILAEVTKLLSHFSIAGIDTELEKAKARDWVNDLSDFPPEAVRSACETWRRSKTKRPVIAEMRVMCTDAERSMRFDHSRALPHPKREYGEGHVDTVSRIQMKAWWQAWKENFPAPVGMPLEEWKELIRTRAKEICPQCTWQMPGEEYSSTGFQ